MANVTDSRPALDSSGYQKTRVDESLRDVGDGTHARAVVSIGSGPYPIGATAVQSSSGNVANAAAVATLAAAVGKTTYIAGFHVTATGATASSVKSLTVAGLIGGDATYTYPVIAGAVAGQNPWFVSFNPPVPASAANTAIVVTLAALGAGNTNATVTAYGYQQ